jgi:hypothetical protein
MAIQYDDLPGSGRTAKSHNLVQLMEQRGQLPELIAALERIRPSPFLNKRLGTISMKKLYEEIISEKAYDAEKGRWLAVGIDSCA